MSWIAMGDRRRRLATVLVALGSLAAPLWAAPEVAFETSAVVISGATAEGEVALYRISREWTGRATRIRETAALLSAGTDGTARFELAADEELPLASVWLAVDLATGKPAVASPPGFEARRMAFPGRSPEAADPGRLRRLELSGRVFHALWVRAGSDPAARGAWSAAVGDGGALDDDGPGNGRMGFDLTRMVPMGASPAAPEELAGGDVLALIDPETLEVFLTTLPAPPAGAQGGQ